MGCSVTKDTWGEKKLHCFSFLERVLDEEVPDSEKNTGTKHWEKPDSDSLDVIQIYIKKEMLEEIGTEMGTLLPYKVVEI